MAWWMRVTGTGEYVRGHERFATRVTKRRSHRAMI